MTKSASLLERTQSFLGGIINYFSGSTVNQLLHKNQWLRNVVQIIHGHLHDPAYARDNKVAAYLQEYDANEQSEAEWREHRSALAKRFAAPFIKVAMAKNQRRALRLHAVDLIEKYAKYRVLFSSDSDTSKEVLGANWNPCFTGLFGEIEHVVPKMFPDLLATAGDVATAIAALRAESNVLNLESHFVVCARVAMGDHPGDNDWYQRLFYLACGLWECTFREQTSLPIKCAIDEVRSAYDACRDEALGAG